MVDPIAGIAIASSILTLAEVGYKISKRTIEFSRLLGDSTPDLQECSNLMEILIRAVKRLQDQLKPGDSVLGPMTALHADLESLFDQCNQTATALLTLLDRLHGSNSLSKAIQVTRKEGEILRIRNKLDQHILALLFILEEHQQAFNEGLRNTVRGLRADFYQFHQKLVEQMSHGFGQVKTAISDSKESLDDARRLIAATGQTAQTSDLRLLSGQQDLLQNLNRMEQAFVSILENGEARLATRFQEQLTEHHAATRTLFQSVYNRQNDDLRAQVELLYQEVTKTLKVCEAKQKKFEVIIPDNHLKIKASFEFGIRNRLIALHISQGMEWVSSTVLFPMVKPSTWLALTVPVPRFDRRRKRCNALDTTVRSAPVNFLIKRGIKKYHLIKIDLSEKQYDQDISKALFQVYYDYWYGKLDWLHFGSSFRLVGISYVKYGSYSNDMQCFTAIESANPYRDGNENSFVEFMRNSRSPSRLLDRFKYKDVSDQTSLYASQMQDGYALMILEGPDIDVIVLKIIFTGTVMIAFTRTSFTTLQEIDRLSLLLRCLDCVLLLWAIWCHGRLKKTLLFFLPLAFPPTAIVKYLLIFRGLDGKDINSYYIYLIMYFTVQVYLFFCLFLIWLANKYDIAIDWKDIPSVFRRSQKAKKS